MYVAEHYLGLKATEREIYLEELSEFKECALCGTAAVLSPVGKVVDHDKEILFPSGMEKFGDVLKKVIINMIIELILEMVLFLKNLDEFRHNNAMEHYLLQAL